MMYYIVVFGCLFCLVIFLKLLIDCWREYWATGEWVDISPFMINLRNTDLGAALSQNVVQACNIRSL